MMKIELVLANAAGLHARPAAQFVQKASSFTSNVTIQAGGKTANAKSILSIMSLSLGQGSKIELIADGSDEAECLDDLQALVESNFGES
jgi:phosphocarrier protein